MKYAICMNILILINLVNKFIKFATALKSNEWALPCRKVRGLRVLDFFNPVEMQSVSVVPLCDFYHEISGWNILFVDKINELHQNGIEKTEGNWMSRGKKVGRKFSFFIRKWKIDAFIAN